MIEKVKKQIKVEKKPVLKAPIPLISTPLHASPAKKVTKELNIKYAAAVSQNQAENNMKTVVQIPLNDERRSFSRGSYIHTQNPTLICIQ